MTLSILTGAGISKESGLDTFRDSGDGLWARYRIEDVCTPDAWRRDPDLVTEFYDLRRREATGVQPNAAHLALAEFERRGHRVRIVTQNVDDLHERAGSTDVLHLHGQLNLVRSERDERLILPWTGDVGRATGPDGARLRPHVVFFGETPFRWDEAWAAVEGSDALLVVGTSLQVYPAAGLVDAVRGALVVVDPGPVPDLGGKAVVIREPATTGVPRALAALDRIR